jgi:Tol biopolymer transport system component
LLTGKSGDSSTRTVGRIGDLTTIDSYRLCSYGQLFLTSTSGVEELFAMSVPDGRWLAYSSNESVVELYVVPFRGGQGKRQLSAHGGGRPNWSRDGKELYFMDSTYNLFSVPVKDVGSALQLGAPQRLVSSPGVLRRHTRW